MVKWAQEALVICHSSGWLIELPRPQQPTVWCIEHFLQENFAFMLVPKSLWTFPGSTTSYLQPRKAGHFPIAGAVPSVFSFRPPMSPKWEYEARRRIERKRDVCPRRRLCDKWWGHSLSEAGRKRGEEVTTQAKFVPGGLFVFSGCTWKSTGFVHAVRMLGEDWEILGVQEARLSWTAIDCILFSFSSTLSDER